jgi:hypothetical protein
VGVSASNHASLGSYLALSQLSFHRRFVDHAHAASR